MEILNGLNDLTIELENAHKQGLVIYYSLNRCVIDVHVQYVDLHMTICSHVIHKEDVLRKYLREKYGMLVRSILIEPGA